MTCVGSRGVLVSGELTPKNGEKVLSTSRQEMGLEEGLIFNDSVKKYKKDMQAVG